MPTPSNRVIIGSYTDLGQGKGGIALYYYGPPNTQAPGRYVLEVVQLKNGVVETHTTAEGNMGTPMDGPWAGTSAIIIDTTFYDYMDITSSPYFNGDVFMSWGDNKPDVIAIVLKRDGVVIDVLGNPNGTVPLLSEPGILVRNTNFAGPEGSYVASDWNSYGPRDPMQDASYSYLNHFTGAEAPQTSFSLGGTSDKVFDENDLNLAPAGFSNGFTLAALSIGSFGGGKLTVSYAGAHDADDHLSVLDQGAGQIGFANGNVTFGGILIGTVQGGQNGSNLTVSFNANATPAAVEALLKALAYRTSDNSPDAARTIKVVLEDSNGRSSEVTSTITITPQNDAPSIDGTKHADVLEGQNATITTAVLNGVDPDDAPADLIYTVSAELNGQVLVNGAHASTFTQSDLAAGRVTFAHDGSHTSAASFKVSLADGGENGVQPVETTVNLTVSRLNHAPVGADKTLERHEDEGAYTFRLADFGFSDPNDSDAPNALKAVYIDAAPSRGTLTLDGVAVTAGQTVSAADIAAGKLVFAPGANQSGDDFSLGFRVVDDGGTALGGDDTSDAVNHITFDVKAVNDAPTAADASFTVLEDGFWGFQPAHFGFADLDDGPSANAFLSLLIDSVPTGGALTLGGVAVVAGQEIAADQIQNLRYTPDPDSNGTDAFTFRVRDDGGTDGGGVDVSRPATITLTVTPVNDAPLAADGRLTLLEDGTHTFSAADFGFSDPKDAGDQLAFVILTALPAAGTLTLAGNPVTTGVPIPVSALGTLTFTPAANASGSGYASLKFQVRDGSGTADGGLDTSAEHTLSIDVTAVNDAPVISGVPATLPIGDTATARPFSAVTIQDVDNATLTVTVSMDRTDLGVISRATGLRANADGTYSITGNATLIQVALRNFTFDPIDNKLAPGLVGTTKFTLSVSDGTNVTKTEVDVAVTSINDRPVVVSEGPIHLDEGASYGAGAATGVLANDTDADHDVLTVSGVTFNGTDGTVGSALAGAYGTLVLNADGSYSYVADRAAATALFAGESGTDTFTYAVSDGNGGTTTGTLTFQVNGTTLLVEGLELSKRTVTHPDGSLTQTIDVPAVPDGGADGVIDVPVATTDSGQTILTATIPTGVGMQISGSPSAKGVSDGLADLVKAIQDRTPAGSADQQALTGGAQGFLASLPADGSVLVQTVDIASAPTNGLPISISGSATASDVKTAVVIDAGGLPSGTELKIDDVDFVLVIGAVRVSGGAGSQVAFGDGSSQWMVLGADDDTLHGGGGDDYVGSHGGHDWLYGDDGNDTVSGGEGNDRLYGGTGQDRLLGGAGDDHLDGGSEADILIGGLGRDRLVGGTGDDGLYGESGRDTLVGGAGQDRLVGGADDDLLDGGLGHDTLLGGSGHDRLLGAAGNDRLYGESGHDTLLGGDGDDRLEGGAGNDWLVGGLGRDVLVGGVGADVFDFDAVADSRAGATRDVIGDFQSGLDRIDLRGIDANLHRGGDQAFSWTGADPAAAFSGRAGELRLAHGILAGDVDGDGRADFEIRIVGHVAVGDVIL